MYLTLGTLFVLADLSRNIDAAGRHLCLPQQLDIDRLEFFPIKHLALLHDDVAAILKVLGQSASVKEFVNTLVTLLLQDTDLVLEVTPKSFLFHRLDLERTFVLVLPLSGKYLNINDRTVDSRRACQAGIFHVAGLFTEDRPEKFLLGRELCLALRRYLANEDRARFDLSANADDASLIEIAMHVLAYVGDISSDLFGAEFGVAGLGLELLY